MPAALLAYPQVNYTVGGIISAKNAKTSTGQNGMNWSFEMINGWYQAARRYTNTLVIVTNSPLVGPIQIQQFILGLGVLQGSYYRFPLPEYNGNTVAPTEQDTGSFAQTLDLKPTSDDGMQWLATIEYGPRNINHDFGSSATQDGSINPLEAAPEVDWSGVIFEVTYPQDANGVPFLNTVGDPFENPPKVEEARQSLVFVRNEQTYNDNYAQSYRMTLNQDNFLGFQPLQAKCKNINGKRIYSSDYGYYWRVTYEFEFRVAYFYNPYTQMTTTYGFQELILNAGLRKLTGNSSPYTPAQILINGAPITNPVALTQSGVPLNTTWAVATEGAVVSGVTINPQPYYLVFQNYPTSVFANLNIPQDILTTNQ
jgi:hypothetical protein